MDTIARNPYRVLGVFANDPIRVRTANIARIRAFNKVGKECHFDSDFTDIFGPIDRSEEAIEQAISSLSSDIEAQYYSCLWLHRTSSLVVAAKAPIDIIRSGIDSDDKGNIVNVIIGAIFAYNNELASSYIIKLFECNSAPSENVKEKYLAALEGGYKGEYDWPPLVWWSRLKNSCNSENGHKDSLLYIAKVYNKMSMDYLREIIGAESFKEKSCNFNSILFMHHLAKGVIEVVKETSDIESNQPHAEAQIILSEYAEIILKSCEKYYNDTRFWDAKPVEDLLVILREIYRISFSSKTKDECTTFGKKVKEEAKFLAPGEVKSSSAAIRKEIESFCSKPNETRWALLLLRNCVSSLIDIKTKLGIDNPYYRRISSQIADNAVYASLAEIDSAERIMTNPTNNRVGARVNLKRVLQQATQLSKDLAQLDLEEVFIKQKLRKLENEIDSCKKRNNINIESVEPSISLETYEEKYKSCTDYQSLVEFIRTYPDSIHFKEATKRIWDIEDEAFPILGDSIPAYRKALLAYKEKYPYSHNESKLLSKLGELLLSRGTLGTVYEYRTMLRLWPNHPKKAIIEGRLDLASFKMCRDVSGWTDYLHDFPNGQYRAEAQKHIDEVKEKSIEDAFNNCQSLSDYNRFILQYPSSNFCEKAIKKIEELIYKQALASGKYEVYLNRYPQGQYALFIHQILDEKCYKSCKTKEDYEKYLSIYPKGKFVDEANKNIRYEKQKKSLIFFSVIVIIGAVIFSIVNIARSNTDNGTTATKTNTTHVESRDDQTGISSRNNASIDNTPNPSVSSNVSVPEPDPDEVYKDNSLETGAKPYASFFGRPQTGENYIDLKTSVVHDYVVIVKRHRDDRYVNHIYIRGGEKARIYVPDGNYDVYFYSGVGWNPNKEVGSFKGGFVKFGSMQKDGPVYLESAFIEYTLYPVQNGNLVLDHADLNSVFN